MIAHVTPPGQRRRRKRCARDLGEELGPTDQRPKQVRSVLEKWVNLGYIYIVSDINHNDI